jgi:hypothetical protein
MIALLSAALLAAAAQMGPSERPTGSRLANKPLMGPKLSAKDQAVGAKAMADCLYDQNERVARAALLASTKERADKAVEVLSGTVRCERMRLGNEFVAVREFKYSTEVMRGMLAERALAKSRPQVAALASLPLQKIYQRPWFAVTGRHLTVDEMGACIADVNPAGIGALIRTVPAAPEEGQAFAALSPDLGRCLRAGTKLQANRQSLRAALAEALFQRLNAPAAPTVEAVKK